MYSDVINDPKVMRLPEAMRWHWVAVLCCSAKNDGQVPPTSDLAFMLRMKETATALILAELHAAGLLDMDETGFHPHNWDDRQFKSDTSNERVKRYREKRRNGECNVTETVTVTPPEQSITETDTKAEQTAAAVPPRSRKKPVRSVPDDFAINATNLSYAKAFGFSEFEIRREHQKFVMHAKAKGLSYADWDAAEHNWLTKAAEFAGRRPRGEVDIADDGLVEVLDQMQLEAWDGYNIALNGKPFPRNKKGGWRFPSKWPPGYELKMLESVQKLSS
jgi:hypothetical protein